MYSATVYVSDFFSPHQSTNNNTNMTNQDKKIQSILPRGHGDSNCENSGGTQAEYRSKQIEALPKRLENGNAPMLPSNLIELKCFHPKEC